MKRLRFLSDSGYWAQAGEKRGTTSTEPIEIAKDGLAGYFAIPDATKRIWLVTSSMPFDQAWYVDLVPNETTLLNVLHLSHRGKKYVYSIPVDLYDYLKVTNRTRQFYLGVEY